MTLVEALQLAVQQHQAGKLHEAELLYRQILQAVPNQVDALHLLGVIAHQVGKHELAADYIRQALRVKPDHAEAYCNLGAVLLALGRPNEAVACFRQAVLFKPDYAGAYANLGTILQNLNKPAEALPYLEQARRLAPDDPGTLTNLGLVLQKLGRLDEAVACYQQAVQVRPNYIEAYLNLGAARQDQGRFDEAATCYEQALRVKPDFAEAFSNLGLVLRKLGRLSEAISCCERALAIKPDCPEAYVNLGVARFDEGKLDEATACFRQSLRLRPNSADAEYNLGNTLLAKGLLTEAFDAFDRAVRIQPNMAGARLNRALLWLLQGDFERGWLEYEWRWSESREGRRLLTQPLWQGEPLASRTILLCSEQGFGDTLQFVRYAPLVSGAGAGVVLLECQQPLVRLLLGGCPGVDQVFALGEPLPAFDVHVPLLSLPKLLGTTSLQSIPAEVPYLEPAADLEQRWRTRLESVPGFRIGIVWQGSPTHKRDRHRSVAIERFAPISRIPGVSLISLQKGAGSEQLATLPGLVDLGGEITDFADTAAVLRSLDLVITVDTALAHLAGALGVAAWVALPYTPDWRWLLERTDSPWYPSLRLFRQSQPGNWDEVFERIAAAVREQMSVN